MRGVTVAVADPSAVAARWAEVLGVPALLDGQARLALEDAEVRFVPAGSRTAEGLSELVVELPPDVRRGRELSDVGGVRVRLLEAD